MKAEDRTQEVPSPLMLPCLIFPAQHDRIPVTRSGRASVDAKFGFGISYGHSQVAGL